ncbi:MAG: 4Fe-4S binding protein [Caldimicrobium sp.]|jgi:ferredoxin-like protein FixX
MFTNFFKKFKNFLWPEIYENNRINLFERSTFIKNFFYQRKNFAYLRTFGDIVFLILIILGLFGPQEKDRNIMLFLSWGVWWTSVVLSWFFLGRMWCALCPFPGLARLLQNLKLSFFKNPPKFLKDKGIHLATFLFFLIIYLESTTSLTSSPRYTSFFLISIVLMAAFFGLLYREYAWCRYICPLGRITGVAATMALIEFRPDYRICKTCKEALCKKGTPNIRPCPVYLGAVAVQNNLNCFICGHCLILCPHNSPAVYLRYPLKEIILNKGKGITCAYVIPFLIGSQLARFLMEKDFFHNWANTLAISPNILFTLLFFWFSMVIIVISKLAASFFRVIEDPILGKFNLTIAILIPFAFTGELIYRSKYFLENIGDFFPTLARQFKIEFFFKWGFTVPEKFIKLWSFFLLNLSLLGSLYLIFYFYYKDFEREIPFKRYLHFVGIVFALYLSYYVLLLRI